MQAENRRFEMIGSENQIKNQFYKKLRLLCRQKTHTCTSKFFGGRIVFQKCDLLLAQVSISISILLFIIIIRDLQHTASKAIEKTVCSKLHNRFCRCFKINDLACVGCVVF